ncbi:prostaglandin E synthase 2-like [Benincasa hispida]|uniref:prostaglandin E synthase 2-like n=1 Tax=Benincasa hispida TaxID=102211 RepID=UPI0018FF236B|nr:prostaglandin E synthase 2-like [Benincasa hispida]
MRRINGVHLLRRIVSGDATTATAYQRLLRQSTVLRTCAGSNIRCFSKVANPFGSYHPSPVRKVAGNGRCVSMASSSLAQDLANDLPPPSLVPKDVVLYQYEACPFCNKVKAFLDYYNVPYKVVEVNPIFKTEIKWSEYKKVPVLMVDGVQMVDSTDIIHKLYQRIHPENSSSNSEEERKWLGWVDNHLVHVLSPNIYRNYKEALESFNYITTHGNFSFAQRIIAKYGGATAMYFVSKKLKERHNITDERKALYGAAETWVNALKGREFLGGANPNLADLAVFGVLRPIRHLQSGKDMVEHTRVGEWYSRMEKAVGESARIDSGS